MTRPGKLPSPRGKSVRPARARLQLDFLEERCVPDCKTISGYVFSDLNNNGLRDPNEPTLASSPIELRNAQGIVIARTVTDANGYYVFDTDATIDVTPKAMVVSGVFPDSRTNATQTLALAQFDPSLGVLQSVEIRINGQVTSTIKVENRDPAPAVIKATTTGNLTVSGPGFSELVTTGTNVKNFNAGAYDGTVDYAGASGKDFGPVTVTGSTTVTINQAIDLASYVGTGTVTLSSIAQASSSATGGGNLEASIASTGGANVTITYRYVPNNCLQPGNYVIVQTKQPAGYLDGLESTGGTVLPGTVGTDRIAVTLGNQNLVNNDFAEILPAKLSGYVYFDKNNNGLREAGENGIAGVQVTLTGTNDLGEQVRVVKKTAADGSYQFENLRPGTYALAAAQASGYLDGKDTVGSLSATVANDAMTQIRLNPGVAGTDFNFGEIKAGSLAGFVYFDKDNNGKMGSKEVGIANVTITLTGTDDLGNAITLTTKTNSKGAYKFANLRPGTYALSETQPAGYKDGKESVGSLGGAAGEDAFTGIVLEVAKAGTNYNFGELKDGGGGSQAIPDPVSKIYFLASILTQKK